MRLLKPSAKRAVLFHVVLAIACTATVVLSTFNDAVSTSDAFQVRVSSKQPGNLFIESQPVDLMIQVSGNKPDVVEYKIREHNGSWTSNAKIPLRSQVDPLKGIPLHLQLPSRGLYYLTVSARAGQSKVEAKTRVGVVFDPSPVNPDSRWGLFTIPYDGENDPAKAAALARSHRLLGAAWSRLNFWHWSYENLQVKPTSAQARDLKISASSNQLQPTDKTESDNFFQKIVAKADFLKLHTLCPLLSANKNDSQVSVSFSKWKGIAQALHREGISVMGEFAEMPRELSSRPQETQETGEGAAVWARVKPRDYQLWNQLVEKTAREFKQEIQFWEIWNEPDANNFWLGTPEEFAELIRQTARAVKSANPKAQIVASGFTSHGVSFLDRVLKQGVAPLIDVFSFHTNDLAPYKALLSKHGVPAERPIWGTEDPTLVSLRGMKEGYARQFHFFHKRFGTNYDSFAALVDRDLTPLPDGITYSVAAHIIGNAQVVESIDRPSAQIYVFQKGNEAIATWKVLQAGLSGGSVTYAVTPLPDKTPQLIDAMGRSKPLKLKNGEVTLPIDQTTFIRDASKIKIAKYSLPREKSDPLQYVFLAKTGKWTKEWMLAQPGKHNPPPASDFWQPFLQIFASSEPSPEGYSVEIPINVPKPGRYQLLFTGITTNSLLEKYRWTSPFAWSIDGGQKTQVTAPLKSYWRVNRQTQTKNELVKPEEMAATGGPELYQELGVVELSQGQHTFRLELTAGRTTPDKLYTTFFEGIVLRPIQEN
ncbi:MAG: hypothetical protein CLLPBCKN_005579 [Chroococcidiopsis cubana SAG 39.79]|jgi:hypothetical protein|uniref:Glycoside hydrolase family 39 n=1 Tax=Chroococcidiopsis thermalis (strain PCC 7203) TaxID=251229 RepID=K9U6Z7_CHRTP|nr:MULTISPECIES: glycoside hydrolase [Chroococcidiopsis]AFY90024.1 glycoside hydrolase family 39 [Chroococcidiopsis thermalis PCC 7203]MDZ4876159.1 hypothetical protein [Chroococcidiopsis cubana SAG 39.79]PSB48158.1 hypothetical protein C7B80_06710 [Cyanosarcina cf. burmensis CCALA 770]PSB64712.1 hypothetical protein C7B79_08625 [Chroococcidiopsis cubana CCALA 043]